MERYEYFVLEKVVNEKGQELDEPVHYMAILAALLGCQGRVPVSASHRLSPQPQCDLVYQSSVGKRSSDFTEIRVLSYFLMEAGSVRFL